MGDERVFDSLRPDRENALTPAVPDQAPDPPQSLVVNDIERYDRPPQAQLGFEQFQTRAAFHRDKVDKPDGAPGLPR